MAGNELLFESVTDAAGYLHYLTELINTRAEPAVMQAAPSILIKASPKRIV